MVKKKFVCIKELKTCNFLSRDKRKTYFVDNIYDIEILGIGDIIMGFVDGNILYSDDLFVHFKPLEDIIEIKVWNLLSSNLLD